jgi:hypothetical protein
MGRCPLTFVSIPQSKLLRKFLVMRGSELRPQTPQLNFLETIHKICEQVQFKFLGQVFRT